MSHLVERGLVHVWTRDTECIALAQLLFACITEASGNYIQVHIDANGTGFHIVYDDGSDRFRH